MTDTTQRVVRVAELMGTVVSVHAIVSSANPRLASRVEAQADASFAQLRDVERVFSTYREDSDLSRLHAGTLTLADADPRVPRVLDACVAAEIATAGRFSAEWCGRFDPTGYVKGWSVEEAFDRHLRPLLAIPGVLAVGMNAGGDMQLATAPGADWTWRIGIAHPAEPGVLAATVALQDGAVATSGTVERGSHIFDPRTGEPAMDALSATVVAPRLSEADVWATAAVVAGFDDLGWVRDVPHTSGLAISPSGEIRRWVSGFEVSQADALLTAPLE